jgi:serine/threonine protein kinase
MDSAEHVRLIAGRYRLAQAIGRGGMGTVWRARDESLSRVVAVKEIVWLPHLSDAEREVARHRAVREAQVTARLNHPNVVRIYDIVEEEGRPWIVMELLPYRSLRDILQDDGPLAPAQAAKVGLGVLAALRAAHAEGVLHRDVKPANILISDEGRVVLTDFGIARAADSPSLTTSGMIAGSPPYISPERAHGGQAGPPGDLWGLGASLYAAVEGRPPFERDGVLASLTAVVNDDPDPGSHAGPLWPVITGLLRKDPVERLDAAQTERMLWHVAANGRTASAVPIAPHHPEPSGARGAEGTLDDLGALDVSDTSPDMAQVPEVSSAPQPRGEPRVRSRAFLAAAAGGAAVVITAAGAAFALLSGGSPQHRTASPSVSSHPGARPSSGTQTSGASSSTSGPATSRSGSGPANPAGYGALPAGFYRFRNPTGFSIGVPKGWQISHVGHYVYVRDPANSGIFLLIDQSDHPKPDPLADWQQQQASRASTYQDYHLIRLQSVRYPQAQKAADWEFTYDRNGVLVHVLNRNVLANPRHAYALYWSTPENDWDAYYHYFRTFAATFRPAP